MKPATSNGDLTILGDPGPDGRPASTQIDSVTGYLGFTNGGADATPTRPR